MTALLAVVRTRSRRSWRWVMVILIFAVAIGGLFERPARQPARKSNGFALRAAAALATHTLDATAVRRHPGTTLPKISLSTLVRAGRLVRRSSLRCPLTGKSLQRYAQFTRAGMQRFDRNAARDIPIVMDVIYGNVAALQRALSAGINPNLQVRTNGVRFETFSLLTFAIAIGQLSSVTELVNDDTSLLSSNSAADASSMNAPLPDAAAGGETTVVRFLLDHGANTGQVGPMGNTALENVVEGGYYATAKLLLAHGPNLNDVLQPGGKRPTYLATAKGCSTRPISSL